MNQKTVGKEGVAPSKTAVQNNSSAHSVLEYAVSPSQTASPLTMAVEGPALTEWAQIGDVERDADNNVIRFQVRADKNNDSQFEDDGWIMIDHDALVVSAYKVIMGQIDVSRNIAAQIVGEWDLDMVGLDVLVQIACFGDVIYC
jgi:hypothetical protein